MKFILITDSGKQSEHSTESEARCALDGTRNQGDVFVLTKVCGANRNQALWPAAKKPKKQISIDPPKDAD